MASPDEFFTDDPRDQIPTTGPDRGPDLTPGPGADVVLLTVAVNNSRARLGVFEGSRLLASRAVPIERADLPGAARAIAKEAAELDRVTEARAVALATVNPPAADEAEPALRAALGLDLYRLGRDLEIPIRHTLDDATTVGHDRLLNAIGAHAGTGEAGVVIDAGTAITVDFVDGEGTFHGGAILPGVRMGLRALHEQTASLPLLELQAAPGEDRPFGKTTAEAMRLGVVACARGAVRLLLERYAEAYDAYPRVVATGGDAAVLFEHEPIVERVVPELQLIGIRSACSKLLET